MSLINSFDPRAYIDAHEDVRTWINSGRAAGDAGNQNEYAKKYNKDTTNWESQWVNELNGKYGTANTDMGQFSNEQIATYHYDTWGGKENRLANDNYKSRATYYNTQDRSTKAIHNRDDLIRDLTGNGYNSNTLAGSTNDELLALGEQMGSDAYQRRQRQQDRADSLSDFGAQLSALTASKQRQAEQAGRIAAENTRSQGLAKMMSNY